ASLLAIALGACAVGPDYREPKRPTPAGWSEAVGERVSSDSADLARWWTAFGDPTLDALIERASAANLDVKIAAARGREARAHAGIVRGALAPQVDASGGVVRSRASENGNALTADNPSNLYSAGFDARWELDVFGGTRRAIEAAEADV